MSARYRLGRCQDLPAGSAVEVAIGDDEIALFNVEGAFHAVEAHCHHQRGPLSLGRVRRPAVVECPWHRWCYDLRTGQRVDSVGAPIGVHHVEVDEGWLYLQVVEDR